MQGIDTTEIDTLPGGGVRWVEVNSHTGVRTIHELRDDRLEVTTEYLGTMELIDTNGEILNNKIGSRWGSGQVYARVPMNLYNGDGYLAQATKAGDQKAIAKFFDDSDNRAFRTFGGRIG